jgi:hypothetical protein
MMAGSGAISVGDGRTNRDGRISRRSTTSQGGVKMEACENCLKAGVYIFLIDRDDHYFCPKCFRRQEKVEPVKRYRFPTSLQEMGV